MIFGVFLLTYPATALAKSLGGPDKEKMLKFKKCESVIIDVQP